jgi:hypothetical protein
MLMKERVISMAIEFSRTTWANKLPVYVCQNSNDDNDWYATTIPSHLSAEWVIQKVYEDGFDVTYQYNTRSLKQ